MKTKETKYDWVILAFRQMTTGTGSPKPTTVQSEACFQVEYLTRRLPSVHVTLTFWGGTKGLPGERYSQAEAFAQAVVSVPRSLEALSRIGLATRTGEHSADVLSTEL